MLAPEQSVMGAIAQMSEMRRGVPVASIRDRALQKLHSEGRSSCVLVVENDALLGILSAHDLVRLIAHKQDLSHLSLREAMTHPPITLQESAFTDLFAAVNVLQQNHIRHLPLLNDRGQVTGLLTQESLRHISRPIDLLRLRLVIEAMRFDVVCADWEDSLLAIAQQMAERQVSSVVVVQNLQGDSPKLPLGIVTERDLMQFQALGLDFTTHQAREVMSSPVFSARAEDSLWDVQQQMERYNVHRLAVVGSQGELIGIITQNHVMQSVQPLELYRLAEGLEARVSQLEAEKIELLTRRTAELEQEVQARTTALEAKARQEHLLTHLSSQIRASLNLQDILDTTVREVRSLLDCDRVIIYELATDHGATAIAEAMMGHEVSVLHGSPPNTWLSADRLAVYRQGEIHVVDDVNAADVDHSLRHTAPDFDSRAQLIVPILVEHRLWGLMLAVYHTAPHPWRSDEVDLVQKLSVHLAIAIRQAIAYQRLETELTERRRAEQSLHQSQATNLAMATAMPDLIIRMSITGGYLDLNSGHEVNVLAPSRPIPEATVHDVLPPALAEERLQYARQALATRTLQVYEQTMKIAGETCYEEVRIVPCGDQEVLVIIRDITERKQAEQALLNMTQQLQANERKFKAIFNNSFQFIGLLDCDGTLLEANETALEFGGLRRQDILNRPFWEMRWWSLSADTQAQLRTAIAQAARGEFVRYEVEVLGEGNHTAVIDFSIRPLRDDDGNVVLLIPEGRDITELKQAEAALRRSEAQSRAVLAAIPDLMFCVGIDGRYRKYIVNNPEIDLFPKQRQPLGQRMADVLPPEITERHHRGLQQAIATGEVQVYEQVVRLGDRLQYEEVRVSKSGEDEALFIIRDISDRKEAELALQQLNHTLEAQVQSRTRALRKLSTLQQGILDGTDYSIIATDLNGTILTFNAAAQELLGYRTSEVVGKATPELFHDAIEMHQRATLLSAELGYEVPAGFEVFTAQSRLGIVQEQEWTYIARDGRRFPVALTVTALRDDRGIAVGFIGIAKDITQRKQAEKHLKDLSDRLKLAVESAQMGIWDWDILHNRLLWDDRMHELYSVSPSEFSHDFEGWQRCIHPDDLAALQTSIHRCLQGQAEFEPEFRVVMRSGTVRFLKAYALVQRDEQGTAIRMIGVNLDITQRKRAEDTLRKNEARFQRIALNAPGVIYQYVMFPDGNFAFPYMSDRAREIFELEVETVQHDGSAIFDLFHADDLPSLHQSIEQSRQTLEQWSWEGRLTTPSGREKWIRGMAQPERMPDGTTLWDGLIIDISDRKQAEAELQAAYDQLEISNEELSRATRLKDEFLANMSHELRTPLNAILGMSEALQEEVYGELNRQQKSALQTVERSGTHLLSLINDILDLSKIEAGQVELHCTPTDVRQICHASWSFVKQLALKKRLSLDMQVSTRLPSLLVDERRIRQVLINLLNNAVKFTPEGGRITLSARRLGETTLEGVEFLVEDTGVGIAPENLDRIFHPFTQIDGALNRQYEGTGLGLTLIKQIVSLHGGEVSVSSELGTGSCFRFTLPANCLNPACDPPPETDPSAILASTPIMEQGNSPLVLLAEDNEANIITVSGYLEAKGYRILLARNGQEAIDLAGSTQPDLILMDIQMPGIDGLTAIAQIRQLPMLARTPIIAVTALAMSGDRERCLAAGADDYIAKPMRLQQLASLIQDHLAHALGA